MRFEVPQFIEIEDKIVGPLTWRQFIYLAGGAGLLIILYFTVPFILFVLFGLPLGALSGFLAFHRINNRPFSAFLEAFVGYTTKKKLYLWRKDEAQEIVVRRPDARTPDEHLAFTEKGSISSLARNLDIHQK